MAKNPVGLWLDKQYIAWQARAGESKTWGEFAAYLGVARGTLDNWSRGSRRPEGANVTVLAEKLGPEIYDLLGLDRPDARKLIVNQVFEALSEEGKTKAVEELRKLAAREQKGRGNEPLKSGTG